jgi:ribosomal-protein-alanine N-acetyltransferase
MVDLESKRLILEPASITFAAVQLELMNTPKWLTNIGDRNINTIPEAEQYIADKMLPQYEELGFGNYFIQLKETAQVIGCVGIYNRPELESYDFGFVLLPSFEKQGYAYEASKCLLQAAKNSLGIKALSAITTASNVASQKLLKKLGFQFAKQSTVTIDEEVLMLYKLSL